MGQTAYAAALGSAFTGQFYATGGLALIGGAAELAYNLSECNTPPPEPPNTGSDNCWEVTGGGIFQYSTPGGFVDNGFGYKKILSQEVVEIQGQLKSQGQIQQDDGQIQNYTVSHNGAPTQEVRLVGDCVSNEPAPPLPPHNPGDPIAPPQTHTDDDGCNWTIQATDAYVDEGGKWHTYYTITADNDACGGPFAYWSSENGPDWVQPNPDGPEPVPPPGANQCPDPCPDNSEDFSELKKLLEEIKACACKNEKPELAGTWISTRWISDSDSPAGERPLRKLFRYRSKSTRNDDQLRTYWSEFAWQAGSTVVGHKGAWWGEPQVWASSEAEGKRVLRFAGGEAGIDPDLDGQWVVGSSRSARYGQSGTMRLEKPRGTYWVTRRDGPSGVPL